MVSRSDYTDNIIVLKLKTVVIAGDDLNIYADFQDADAGEGARIDILGTLNSPLSTIFGEDDNDVIYLATLFAHCQCSVGSLSLARAAVQLRGEESRPPVGVGPRHPKRACSAF